MIGVQCQLLFVEDLFSYQKAPLENVYNLQFCCKPRHCEFFRWAAACLMQCDTMLLSILIYSGGSLGDKLPTPIAHVPNHLCPPPHRPLNPTLTPSCDKLWYQNVKRCQVVKKMSMAKSQTPGLWRRFTKK